MLTWMVSELPKAYVDPWSRPSVGSPSYRCLSVLMFDVTPDGGDQKVAFALGKFDSCIAIDLTKVSQSGDKARLSSSSHAHVSPKHT